MKKILTNAKISLNKSTKKPHYFKKKKRSIEKPQDWRSTFYIPRRDQVLEQLGHVDESKKQHVSKKIGLPFPDLLTMEAARTTCIKWGKV